MITFSETVDTLKIWVGSCQTNAQLDLIKDVMAKLLIERFRTRTTPAELLAATNEIDTLLLDKQELIYKMNKELFESQLNENYETSNKI